QRYYILSRFVNYRTTPYNTIANYATDVSDQYHMVFEFAYDGTLRTYLSKNFDNLTWKSKYKLGLDIANGLKYLHALEIIHKDLVLFIFTCIISLYFCILVCFNR